MINEKFSCLDTCSSFMCLDKPIITSSDIVILEKINFSVGIGVITALIFILLYLLLQPRTHVQGYSGHWSLSHRSLVERGDRLPVYHRVHTIHTCQGAFSNSHHVHIFGLWEGISVPIENPQKHMKNTHREGSTQ